MTIWVDADSCPVRVREIVAKAALARKIPAVFTANRRIPLKKNAYVSALVVGKTEGSADASILRCAKAGDLVITRDIPLAAELVRQGLCVINDRGNAFSADTVAERLSLRDFMKDLRDQGLYENPEGGFGPREAKLFADAFDRELTRLAAPFLK
ncbi:MAG: DUF188 domain-containing protein [Spirochaetia bacterium]|jgi:uncharacterized protein YaiI (UPF0178 family)|nr:DUF188 domain-containing protein [Spirochaetia bacterium]